MMPCEPQCSQKDEPSLVGSIKQNLYSCECGGIVMDAEFSNLPVIAAMFGGRSRIYNDAADEFLKREGARKISFESMTLDAYRGRILTYETNKCYGKLWLLLISRRLYVLNASVPKNYPDKSVIDFYFNSFRPTYKVTKEAR